jgi:hypothetical protein
MFGKDVERGAKTMKKVQKNIKLEFWVFKFFFCLFVFFGLDFAFYTLFMMGYLMLKRL